MARPISFYFLILFILYGISDTVTDVLAPVSFALVFDHYGLPFLYDGSAGIIIFGGIGLVYAIFRKNEWGYTLGISWLGFCTFYTLFSIGVSILDKPTIEDFVIARGISAGGDFQLFTEYVGSELFDYMLFGAFGAYMFAYLFFIWRLILNRDFFSNPNTI